MLFSLSLSASALKNNQRTFLFFVHFPSTYLCSQTDKARSRKTLIINWPLSKGKEVYGNYLHLLRSKSAIFQLMNKLWRVIDFVALARGHKGRTFVFLVVIAKISFSLSLHHHRRIDVDTNSPPRILSISSILSFNASI